MHNTQRLDGVRQGFGVLIVYGTFTGYLFQQTQAWEHFTATRESGNKTLFYLVKSCWHLLAFWCNIRLGVLILAFMVASALSIQHERNVYSHA